MRAPREAPGSTATKPTSSRSPGPMSRGQTTFGTFHGTFTRESRPNHAPGARARSRACRPARPKAFENVRSTIAFGNSRSRSTNEALRRELEVRLVDHRGQAEAEQAAQVLTRSMRLPVGLLGVHRKMTLVRSVTARIMPTTSCSWIVGHRHEHRDAAGHARARLVHAEGRHADQHLFAGTDEGADDDVDELGGAGAEQHGLAARAPSATASLSRQIALLLPG